MSFICNTCGKTVDEIQEHHVLPRGLGGTDLPTNIVHVCLVCHSVIHSRLGTSSSSLVMGGLQRARERGIRLGPPIKVNDQLIDECLSLRKSGMSFAKISKRVDLAVATVHKIIHAHTSVHSDREG
jgi:hypothetical protein